MQAICSNMTPQQRLSGTHAFGWFRKDCYYIAWSRAKEGPARPELVAALADLRDIISEQNPK